MSNKAIGSEGFQMVVVDLDERSKGMDARIVHIIMHSEIIVKAKTEIVKALKWS